MNASPRPSQRNRLARAPFRTISLIVGALALAALAAVLVDRALQPAASAQSESAASPGGRTSVLRLKSCAVQGISARCGTFVVPEDRAKPNGRTIGLRVVVLPAALPPAAKDAVTYLDGGPGAAASEEAADLSQELVALNTSHDVLLVDQRGTGGSNPHGGDVTQYGTRVAMDDLDAVRAALGYRQLDVIGGSYGATAAQVYARLHPSSVRALMLDGATAIDVPIFGHWARSAQRALDQLAKLCDSDVACRKAFPNWERQFGELVKAWNAHPLGTPNWGVIMTGDQLASIVHGMLLAAPASTVSIPFIVSSAAKGDYAPLYQAGEANLGPADLNLMGSSIWCSEPWAGLDAKGPWGTDFDGYTKAFIASFRQACATVPKRAEPPSLWALPNSSKVPVLVFEGGADPQDPATNLSDLNRHFPDSRVVILPHVGHQFGIGGCVDEIMANFVERGTTKGLDTTRCDGMIGVPPFTLSG